MTPAARPSRAVAMLWTLAATFAAFLAAAPYTLIELPVFLNQFARLSAEYRTVSPGVDPVWLIYLKHLRNALGGPGSAIVIAGLAVGAWRATTGPSRPKWILTMAFPLLYFRFISDQNIVYGRYLLPLLPFLSLLGAAGVVRVVDQLRHTRLSPATRRWVILGLTLLSVGPPAYSSMAFDANAARVWTNEQAYDWILRSVPKGSKVVLESRQMLLPERYKATYVAQLRLRPYQHYLDEGIDYLVASSQSYGPYFDAANGGPQKYPHEVAEYTAIFTQTEEVARFTPSASHPGPELRILRVKRTAP
jgi:hypothetical protein